MKFVMILLSGNRSIVTACTHKQDQKKIPNILLKGTWLNNKKEEKTFLILTNIWIIGGLHASSHVFCRNT